MAFSSTIRLVFTGDSSGAEKAAKRTEDSLDRLNATGKRAFGGLGDSLGNSLGAFAAPEAGAVNVQGEAQKRVDVIGHEIFIRIAGPGAEEGARA